MVRDLRRLADTRFDVLVIGAGIYGAAAAWDAVQRGLNVALIDRGDVGAGTSFNNLKTLHGGLRSLQAMNLGQMRRFIRERRALARIAPHLVRPLPFIVPTSRSLTRSGTLMRMALAVNDLVARDRNEGIADPALHLPRGRIVDRDEALRLNPVIDPSGVTGGALWYDYQMLNADRMTFAFAQSAAAKGAAVANYVTADSLVIDAGRVAGVRARDERGADTFEIRARVVINAAGAWAAQLVESLPESARAVPAPLLSRAINVIVDQPALARACGGTVDGRFLFLVPWRGLSILGTSHDPHTGPPDALRVTAADLESFMADGRRAFPGARLAIDDVRLVHRGLLPMVAARGRDVTLLRESAVVSHRAHGAPGLVSIHGVRYTTARDTAVAAVDAAFAELGHTRPPPSQSDRTPLLGGDIQQVSGEIGKAGGAMDGARPGTAERLVTTYGTRFGLVAEVLKQSPALAAPLGEGCAVTGAEITFAARDEMALTLTDALIRRTEAGSAGHPGADAVARAAEVMAAEHGWDAERRRDEIAAVEAFYQLPT